MTKRGSGHGPCVSPAGSFRLSIEEVPDLIDMLRRDLSQVYDDVHPAYVRGVLAAG
ncbi:MAG TPA: hypothetical protein VFD59_04885 [Nocardioidaceae bacterium]|nr:hypothetical protein [Nocardioidaceae bacterium]